MIQVFLIQYRQEKDYGEKARQKACRQPESTKTGWQLWVKLIRWHFCEWSVHSGHQSLGRSRNLTGRTNVSDSAEPRCHFNKFSAAPFPQTLKRLIRKVQKVIAQPCSNGGQKSPSFIMKIAYDHRFLAVFYNLKPGSISSKTVTALLNGSLILLPKNTNNAISSYRSVSFLPP